MRFDEYMKQNAPTEEQLQRAEREREAERERQKALEEAKKAQEEERRRKVDKEPTKEDKAAAEHFYKELREGLLLGESPAALLLKAMQALALLFRTPKEEQDKLKAELETIQGRALGDFGARGVEVAEIEARLKLLNEAAGRGDTSYTERKLIERSIKANTKRLQALQQEAESAEDSLF